MAFPLRGELPYLSSSRANNYVGSDLKSRSNFRRLVRSVVWKSSIFVVVVYIARQQLFAAVTAASLR